MTNNLIIARYLNERLPFHYGWLIVFAAGTTTFARMAPSVTTLAVFVSPMADEFGWSRTVIAGAVSVGALSSILVSPIVGWAIDRFGSRLILAGSMLVLGLAVASLAWATVPASFYIGFATGRIIFHVPVQIGTGALIARWFVEKQGRAIGVIYMAGAVGGIVTVQIAALGISHWSIGAAWISLGVSVLVVAFLPSALLIVDRPQELGLEPYGHVPPSQSTSLSQNPTQSQDMATLSQRDWTLREAMGTKTLWALIGVFGTLLMIQAGISVHVGAFYQDQGLSLTVVAMAITIHGIFNAFGSLIWGNVIDRVPIRLAIAGLMMLSAGTTLAILKVDSAFAAYAASGVFGVVAAGGNVLPPVAYASYFGHRYIGSIRGMSEIGVQVGQSIGSVLSGLIYDLNGSYSAAFLTFTVLGFLSSFAIYTFIPPNADSWKSVETR